MGIKDTLDALIVNTGRRAVAALKRSTKITPKTGADKVAYQPNGWTMGGQVD